MKQFAESIPKNSPYWPDMELMMKLRTLVKDPSERKCVLKIYMESLKGCVKNVCMETDDESALIDVPANNAYSPDANLKLESLETDIKEACLEIYKGDFPERRPGRKPERNSEIFHECVIEKRIPKEVAEEYGISNTRVHEIKRQGIRTFNQALKNKPGRNEKTKRKVQKIMEPYLG